MDRFGKQKSLIIDRIYLPSRRLDDAGCHRLLSKLWLVFAESCRFMGLSYVSCFRSEHVWVWLDLGILHIV